MVPWLLLSLLSPNRVRHGLTRKKVYYCSHLLVAHHTWANIMQWSYSYKWHLCVSDRFYWILFNDKSHLLSHTLCFVVHSTINDALRIKELRKQNVFIECSKSSSKKYQMYFTFVTLSMSHHSSKAFLLSPFYRLGNEDFHRLCDGQSDPVSGRNWFKPSRQSWPTTQNWVCWGNGFLFSSTLHISLRLQTGPQRAAAM